MGLEGGYYRQRLGSINLKLLNSVSHFLSEAIAARLETNRKIHSNTQKLAGGAIPPDRRLFSKGLFNTIQRLEWEGKRISYLSTYYEGAPPRPPTRFAGPPIMERQRKVYGETAERTRRIRVGVATTSSN